MFKSNSDGEVFGSKVLTLAMIVTSALVLAGTIYSPAQTSVPRQVQPTVEQLVVTAHPAPAAKVEG